PSAPTLPRTLSLHGALPISASGRPSRRGEGPAGTPADPRCARSRCRSPSPSSPHSPLGLLGRHLLPLRLTAQVHLPPDPLLVAHPVTEFLDRHPERFSEQEVETRRPSWTPSPCTLASPPRRSTRTDRSQPRRPAASHRPQRPAATCQPGLRSSAVRPSPGPAACVP